jgi:chromate transporter
MIYWYLFIEFFKIGLFTFGGGYAMISLVMETSVTKGWLSESEILNFIAICESTPGPIAINMATFVGSSQAGILGSICATLGVVLPSFIIILLIAIILHNLLKIKAVTSFIDGIKPTIVGLISATFITLFLSNIFNITSLEETQFIFNWQGLIIFAVVVIASFTYKKVVKKAVSPILLILLSGLLGILFYTL